MLFLLQQQNVQLYINILKTTHIVYKYIKTTHILHINNSKHFQGSVAQSDPGKSETGGKPAPLVPMKKRRKWVITELEASVITTVITPRLPLSANLIQHVVIDLLFYFVF